MSPTGEPQPFDYHADVSAQRIAKVYAEALLNAAEKRQDADAVADQLDSLIDDVFKADSEFEKFLASGAVGRNQKAELLRRLFGQRAGELFLNFLMVLNDHERLDLLRPIRHAFRDLRDERARRMRVRVRSAVPLAEDQRQRLVRELHETFHLEPVLEPEVDPALLGGMVVRVGDWVYDASIRTRLQTIRNQIIARSSYEIQSGRNRFSSPVGD
jgi:F-type H+-transporting ATPase subunit delta